MGGVARIGGLMVMDERATRATRQLERWWIWFERERRVLAEDESLHLDEGNVARLLALELR